MPDCISHHISIIRVSSVYDTADKIYKAFIDQAVEYSRSYGGVFVGAHACTIGGGSHGFSGGTSPDAQRVWKSLERDYNSSGMVIFIGL